MIPINIDLNSIANCKKLSSNKKSNFSCNEKYLFNCMLVLYTSNIFNPYKLNANALFLKKY
jgi:hypothetical protein